MNTPLPDSTFILPFYTRSLNNKFHHMLWWWKQKYENITPPNSMCPDLWRPCLLHIHVPTNQPSNQPQQTWAKESVWKQEGGGRFDFIFVPCKMCFHFKFDTYKTVRLIHLESKILNRFKSRSMNITCTHLKWDACNLFMCFCSEIEYSNVRRRRDGSKGNGVTEYQSSPQKITSTKLQMCASNF